MPRIPLTVLHTLCRSSDILHMGRYPYTKTAVQMVHSSGLSRLSDLLCMGVCSAR